MGAPPGGGWIWENLQVVFELGDLLAEFLNQNFQLSDTLSHVVFIGVVVIDIHRAHRQANGLLHVLRNFRGSVSVTEVHGLAAVQAGVFRCVMRRFLRGAALLVTGASLAAAVVVALAVMVGLAALFMA